MKILVCTDFSAASAAAEREAAARYPDAELIVFHASDPRFIAKVVEMTGLDAAKLRRDVVHYADTRLQEIIDRLISQGRKAIAELVEADPVNAALQSAKTYGVDLIVLGSGRIEQAMNDARFKTEIVRRSPRRVLVVPGEM